MLIVISFMYKEFKYILKTNSKNLIAQVMASLESEKEIIFGSSNRLKYVKKEIGAE